MSSDASLAIVVVGDETSIVQLPGTWLLPGLNAQVISDMSVLPAKKNFTIWRGGTWRKQLTLYTGATVDTDPRDLTGYTAAFMVEDLEDVDLFTLTTVSGVNGVIVLGGIAGTITVVIPDDVTEALAFDAARYELRITAPGGDTDPILWGGISVLGV